MRGLVLIASSDIVVDRRVQRVAWLGHLLVAASLSLSGAAVAQPVDGPQHRIVPLRPMAQDIEVLHGDPDKAGEPFVMRIRELPGGVIPPHRHPVDEHITVLKGTLYFAVGDKFERAALREMKAGSYAFIPKGSTMFGYTPLAAIVQVHGTGPFHIHWRDGDRWHESYRTLDGADAETHFRYGKGERVATARGAGRIRQGFHTGEVVAYEIQGAKGLFMAEEREIRPAARRR
jgi:quercetin dioxygenase-like cupin family protein